VATEKATKKAMAISMKRKDLEMTVEQEYYMTPKAWGIISLVL
jgi:hypothetical protein